MKSDDDDMEMIHDCGVEQADALLRGACAGTPEQRKNQILMLEVTAYYLLSSIWANRIMYDTKDKGEFMARRSNIEDAVKQLREGIEEHFVGIRNGDSDII